MAKVISWIVNDKYVYLGQANNDFEPTISDYEQSQEFVSDLSYYWLNNNNKDAYRSAYKKMYEAVNGIYTNLNPPGSSPYAGADVYYEVLSQKGVMVISGKDGKNNDDPETPYYNLHNMNQNVAIGLGGDYVLDVDVTARTEFYLERNGIVRNNDITNIRVIGADNYRSGITENTVTLDIKVPKNTNFATSPHNKTYPIIVECNNGTFTAQTYFTVTGVKDGAEGAYFNLIIFPKIVKKIGEQYSDALIDLRYTTNESTGNFAVKYKQGSSYEPVPASWLSEGIPASVVDSQEGSVMVLGLFYNDELIDSDTCTVTRDGIDAATHAVVELDNEMDGISLGDDNVLNANVSVGSGARLWSGRSEANITKVVLKDISRIDPAVVDCSVKNGNTWVTKNFDEYKEATFPISVTTNKAEFKINFKDGYIFDNYRETITVGLYGRVGGEEIYAETNYIVIGVKGGKDGEVFMIMPSVDFVSYDPNISQYSRNTISFDAYVGLDKIEFDETYEPYFSVNFAYSSYDELINAQGVITGNTNVYDFDESLSGVNSVTLYLVYKDELGEGHIIDRETVPVIWNGLNGSDRIYLEIEDEIDPVSLGGDYVLDTETEFETSFVLYSGGTGITFAKFEIEVSDNSFDGVVISAYTNEITSYVGTGTVVDKRVTFEVHENDGHASIAFMLGSGVTFDDDHKKRLTITAYREIDGGFEQYAAIYTVLGIKEGEDGATYALMPSVNAIGYDPNTDLFSPEVINCDAYCSGKKISDKRISSDSKFYITYTINTASQNETTTGGTYELTLNGINVAEIKRSGTDVERIFFYMFYEYEEGKFIMFDRESVPVVDDGINASEKVFLELEDEIDPVSLGGDYELNTPTEFKTSFVLYSGSTEIPFDSFKIKVSDSTLNHVCISVSTNGIDVTANTINDTEVEFGHLPQDTKRISIAFKMPEEGGSPISFENDAHKKYLTITAYRGSSGYSVDYIILGIKEGEDGATYALMPSENSVVYDPNTKEYSPEAIGCDAYIDNEKIKVWTESDQNSKFYIRYTVNGTASTIDNTEELNTNELSGQINFKDLENRGITPHRIYFYLFFKYEDSGNVNYIMLDRESVPIVSDGTNAAERVFLEVEDEIDPVLTGSEDYILNNKVDFDTSFVFYSGTTAISFDAIEITASDDTLVDEYCYITAGTKTAREQFKIIGNVCKVVFDLTGYVNYGYGSLHLELGGPGHEISFENNNHKKILTITVKKRVDEVDKTYSANYTLLGIRDGVDGTTYSLRPSVNSATYDPNIGKYNPPSITCEAYVDTEKIVDHSMQSTSKFYITYTLNTYVIDDDKKEDTEDLPVDGINLLQVGGNDLKRIYFYLYFWYDEGNEWIQLDRESVPILRDGEDGEDGKDADDRIYLELDNEMDGIAIGNNDDKLDEYVTVEIPLALYSGSTEINFDKLEIEADTVISENQNPNFVNYECVITNNNEEPYTTAFDANSTVTYEHIGLKIVNVKIKLEPGLTFGEGSRRIVTFKATYLTEVFTTKYTIIGLQRGEDGVVYKVLPLDNEVRYDPNTEQFFPSTLSCQAYEGTREIKLNEEDFAIRYKIGEVPPANYADSTAYTGSITMTTAITRVYFCLYTKFGNDWLLLDRESVPVIKEGLNAQNRIYVELDEETTGIGLGGDSQLDLNPASYPDGFLPIEIDFHLFSGKTTLGIEYINVNGPISFNTYNCKCHLSYSTEPGGTMSDSAVTHSNFDVRGNAEFTFSNSPVFDCKLILCIKDKYNFGSDNGKEVKITVKETVDGLPYAAKYTIVGVRDGADGAVYKLIPDANTIIYDPNTNAYDPMDLGCDVYYGGEKITIERNNAFNGDATKPYVVAYTVNNPYIGDNPGTGGTPAGLSILGIDNEGVSAKLNLPTISSDLKRIYFYLYLLDRVNDRYLKVDAESIPVAYDGVNAETVGYLELDNEMDGIGLKNRDGEDYILDNGATVKVPFCIYTGLTKLSITKFQIEISDPDITGCTCQLQNTEGGNITNPANFETVRDNVLGVSFDGLSISGKAVAVITLKEGLSFETIRTKKFTFTAFHNSDNYSAFYSVVGVPGGADGESFRLIPSVTSGIFDPSKASGEQYDPSIMYCSAFTGTQQIVHCYSEDNNPQEFALTVNKGSSLSSYNSDQDTGKLLSREHGIGVNSKDRIYFQLWYHYGATADKWMIIDSESVPVLTEGKQGLRGAAMRGPYIWDDLTALTATRRFCNGIYNGEPGQKEGDSLFIDILLKGGQYYLCTTSYDHPVRLGDNWDAVKGNWTTADTQYNFVAANVIFAGAGHINFMSNNEIYLLDQNNNITGGAKGGTGTDIIFWAGDTYDVQTRTHKLEKAPFRVQANGDLYASTGTFAGAVRIPYVGFETLPVVSTVGGRGHLLSIDKPYIVVEPSRSYSTNSDYTVRDAAHTSGYAIYPTILLPEITGDTFNGVTFRIIANSAALDNCMGVVLIALQNNSTSNRKRIFDYAHARYRSINGTAFGLHGGYIEITCIGYAWCITNCSGTVDIYNDTTNYLDYYQYSIGTIFSQSDIGPEMLVSSIQAVGTTEASNNSDILYIYRN